MGRPAKQARLYRHERSDRAPLWMLRHGKRMFGTGTADKSEAEKQLQEYLADPDRFIKRRNRNRSRRDPQRLRWVYFIEVMAEGRPVKIGVADDVRARVWNLGVGSPFELRLVASAEVPQMAERLLHTQLAAARLRGEWYSRSPEVEAAIAAAKAGTLWEFLGSPAPSKNLLWPEHWRRAVLPSSTLGSAGNG